MTARVWGEKEKKVTVEETAHFQKYPQICLKRTFTQVSGHSDQTDRKQTMTALKAQNFSTEVLISQVEKPELWKKCPSVPTHTSPAPMVLTFLKFLSHSNTFVLS
ncbi:hypothetical protein STEG23_012011, partial [Scotinomys teguina]